MAPRRLTSSTMAALACTERAKSRAQRETSRVEVVPAGGIEPPGSCDDGFTIRGAHRLLNAGMRLLALSERMLPNAARQHRESKWWTWPGSNRRPPGCRPGALPVELHALVFLDCRLLSAGCCLLCWCRPPVLPRILLVFSQTCDSYARAA